MIAVYGATGYTGKLVAAELRRRGIEHVLAGRNAERLHALEGNAEIRVAAHDDPTALRRAFADADAVISCAGPFLEVGDEVVAAAIATGSHYVDTTGETPFIRRVVEHHGPAAQRAGVALVSGMGFDYLPGDLLCAVAAEGLSGVRDITIAYALDGFGATRGTTRSAFLMMGNAPARQPIGMTFEFPAPRGRTPMANYPSGEAVTVPLHVPGAHVKAIITASTFAPHPKLARAVPLLTPPLAVAMRSATVRRLLDKVVDRLPEGPPAEQRSGAAFTLVAEARSGAATQRAVLHGSDVYGITAVTTVHGAALMSEPGYDRAGGLAPAQAYDPREFLAALEPHGITVDAPTRTNGAVV